MQKRFIIGLIAGLGLLAAVPASAQTARRNDTSYDKEFGVKYSLLYEEGGYWAGFGMLFEGGFKVCNAG